MQPHTTLEALIHEKRSQGLNPQSATQSPLPQTEANPCCHTSELSWVVQLTTEEEEEKKEEEEEK